MSRDVPEPLPGHLSAEQIPSLVDRLLESDTAAAHLHLLRCPGCREAVLGRLPPGTSPARSYQEVCERVEAAASALLDQLQQERAQAPLLWEELNQLSLAVCHEKVATDSRYQTISLAELLAAESEAARPADLGRSQELLLLALGIAEHLPPRTRRQMTADDLRARLHAELGETWRRAKRLDMAEEAFAQASPALADLPLLDTRGRFCWLLARLRMGQGRRDEAEALYQRAAALYQELGRPDLAARVQLDRGVRALGCGDEELFRAAVQSLRAEGFAEITEQLVDLLESGGFEQIAVHEAVERLTEPLIHQPKAW
jgi:tetratricopeptide (TPR) repeat protein